MAIPRHLRHSAVAAAIAVLTGALLTSPIGSGSAGATSPNAGSRVTDGRIVYDEGNTGQLFTINPDGSAKVQVTHVPSGQFAAQPVWTPDASHIVFVTNPGGGDILMFVMRRNGTGMHQLVPEQKGFEDFTPAVTPDGKSVVYTRCRPDPPGGCALFVVGMNGTGRHALTQFGRGQNADRADFWANVSPDGTQVTFDRFTSRGITSQMWVIGIDGRNPHPVTRPRLEAGVGRWDRDGQHLLITSHFFHLGNQICRISASGGGLELLTHSRFPHNNQLAAPSPSGSRIAFVSDRAYSQPLAGDDLLVMQSNGRGQHRIARGNIFASDWGTAPLLPASAATPSSELTPPRPARQVHAVERRLEPSR